MRLLGSFVIPQDRLVPKRDKLKDHRTGSVALALDAAMTGKPSAQGLGREAPFCCLSRRISENINQKVLGWALWLPLAVTANTLSQPQTRCSFGRLASS
jgi:hypothetical protein